MNLRIHSSLASNSGSVEKSQVISSLLNGVIEELDALVDHADDGSRQSLVGGVRPFAAPVKHEVVAEDCGVLVQAHRREPSHLLGIGAVEAVEILKRHIEGPAWIGGGLESAADGDDAKTPQVQQGLADLSNLPVENRHDLRATKQHVPVVKVTVNKRRSSLRRHIHGEQPAELTCAAGELLRSALHEHGPAHHLGLQAD